MPDVAVVLTQFQWLLVAMARQPNPTHLDVYFCLNIINEAHLGVQLNPWMQSSSAAACTAATSEHPKALICFYCDDEPQL